MHLVFGHQKDPSTELAHWRYWYNQQPNPNQRAFDIDVKACQSVDERIEEVGCNALSFTWNPNVRAKVGVVSFVKTFKTLEIFLLCPDDI